MKKYWGVFCFDQFEFSIFASKKSTTNRFVSRNANFSGKVWPRLRPAGSQGRERIWDDDGDNIAILVILTRMSDAGWKWTRFWPGGNELLVIQGIIRLLNRNFWILTRIGDDYPTFRFAAPPSTTSPPTNRRLLPAWSAPGCRTLSGGSGDGHEAGDEEEGDDLEEEDGILFPSNKH